MAALRPGPQKSFIMQTSRRRFIQSALGCAAGLTFGETISLAAMQMKNIPIGFQLFTVRGAFEKDVPGTIQKLAQMGYAGVEFWAYTGTPDVWPKYSAADLKKILDDNGIKCCGIHMDPKALAKENIQRTIDNNKVLGNIYLNVAGAKDRVGTVDAIKKFADYLIDAQTQCAPHGMMVGYHAHSFDFDKIDGKFAWERLFEQLPPTLNMQMDVGNSLSGNGDPVGMLQEFPGRTRSIHIKEYKDKTFDSDYYKEVFHLCETTSGTKWYIVEMGDDNGDGFDVPREALAKLHKLGK